MSNTAREWFKNMWVSKKDESNYDEEDFETIFKKNKDSWYEDFKEYYEEVKLLQDCFQHPKYVLSQEGWDTMLWNGSWEHADINNRKISK